MLNELLACTRVLCVLLGLKTMTSTRVKKKKISSVFNFPSSRPSGSMENTAGSVRLAFKHRLNVFRSIWSCHIHTVLWVQIAGGDAIPP